MKKTTYRILRAIPIVGTFLRVYTEPIGLYGSLERESGYTDKTIKLYEEYLKTHPNEQLTRQLVNKLWASEQERNANKHIV